MPLPATQREKKIEKEGREIAFFIVLADKDVC
jgi:hypothetical protein